MVAPLRNNSYGGGSVVALVRVAQGGMPRSQQHDQVLPSAGTHQPSVGGRCWLLSYGLGRTGRRLSAASGYIQPRALCSLAEGIPDTRLQMDYMLQHVWRMQIPMKRPATPYEKQPKAKKEAYRTSVLVHGVHGRVALGTPYSSASYCHAAPTK